MSTETSRIKVWDLPTRTFHWALAVSFLGAYFTSEGHAPRPIHVMFGCTVQGLLAYNDIGRNGWGS